MPVLALGADLAFKPAGEGLYEFNTSVFKGRLKLDDKYQGLSLIEVASGLEITHPPDVFSYYRVLASDHRYGHNVRDWPTTTRVLADGAVEARFLPPKEAPLELTAVYRWRAADTLDLETIVKPRQDMTRMEVFISSYFTKGFLASVNLKPEGDKEAKPRFVPVDRKPDSKGGYVMFPRDKEAERMIRDGRWTYPPNPVDWAIERWLATPLVIRRDKAAGLTAAIMIPPEDCFAISSPWNPASPDARGYRSLYFSLFGRDMKAGQTARAHTRLLIRPNLSDEGVIRLYQEYLKEQKRE